MNWLPISSLSEFANIRPVASQRVKDVLSKNAGEGAPTPGSAEIARRSAFLNTTGSGPLRTNDVGLENNLAHNSSNAGNPGVGKDEPVSTSGSSAISQLNPSSRLALARVSLNGSDS
jgi:hypothetical protein